MLMRWKATVCLKANVYARLTASPLWQRLVPHWLTALIISKPSFWVPGFLAGLALLIEEPRRRAELAMYVLPKGLESAWVAARGRGLVFPTGNWGESALTGVAMGMVMVRFTLPSRSCAALTHLRRRAYTRTTRSTSRGWYARFCTSLLGRISGGAVQTRAR
jgi:hypothetical protein